MSKRPADKKSFEEAGKESQSKGLLAEYWDFLKHNKKFWMIPLLVILLGLGLLVVLGGSGIAPALYPHF